MADQATKRWRTVRGQRPLNEDEVARHRQALDAEAGFADGAPESPRAEGARGDEDHPDGADRRES